jgi:hypothetical protein
MYAAFISISTVALFHEPAATGTREPTANTSTLDPQQRERALRAEAGALKAFLLALPWILILDPSSGHIEFYFADLLLNVATVYALTAWLVPPPHRRAK